MNSRKTNESPRFIWATRGRTWGFRFLRDGGYGDPLGEYERAFTQIGDQPEAWGRVSDEVVALRFLDPSRRKDAAGRVIPHEFVLIGPWARDIDSLDRARLLVWDLVAEEFDDAYERAEPPAPRS